MLDDEFFQLIAKYKFAIAIENAICEDYVTEKLWRPLHVGTIPIVLGSPRIKVSYFNLLFTINSLNFLKMHVNINDKILFFIRLMRVMKVAIITNNKYMNSSLCDQKIFANQIHVLVFFFVYGFLSCQSKF